MIVIVLLTLSKQSLKMLGVFLRIFSGKYLYDLVVKNLTNMFLDLSELSIILSLIYLKFICFIIFRLIGK